MAGYAGVIIGMMCIRSRGLFLGSQTCRPRDESSRKSSNPRSMTGAGQGHRESTCGSISQRCGLHRAVRGESFSYTVQIDSPRQS